MNAHAVPEIVVNPSSILIPLNVRADFECAGRCERGCVIIWNIRGVATPHQHQKAIFMAQGFIFSDTLIFTDGLHKNTLSVNTSDITVNNTRLHCDIRNIYDRQSATSNIANLRLISGSPLLTNPYVGMELSSSPLSLKWSPPYTSGLDIASNTTVCRQQLKQMAIQLLQTIMLLKLHILTLW